MLSQAGDFDPNEQHPPLKQRRYDPWDALFIRQKSGEIVRVYTDTLEFSPRARVAPSLLHYCQGWLGHRSCPYALRGGAVRAFDYLCHVGNP